MRNASAVMLGFISLCLLACGGGVQGNADAGSGLTWTPVTASPDLGNSGFSGVAFGNSAWVAVGHGLRAWSGDGTTWTETTVTDSNYYAEGSVGFGGGLFVTAGEQGVSTSTNGSSWTDQVLTQAQGLGAPTYGGGTWVMFDDRFLTDDVLSFWVSSTGASWTQVMTTIPYSQPASIAYGNGTFVAVGYGSLVATSADGSHWSQQSLGANDGLFGVTFGGGAFVAVSTVGTAYKSTDGKTWTQASAFAGGLGGICYGNGVYVAVGANGGVSTSPDGTTWTPELHWSGGVSGGLSFTAVAFGEGEFVAVANGQFGIAH